MMFPVLSHIPRTTYNHGGRLMFAVIFIPEFFLQAALRPEPELHSRAVALIDTSASNPLVLQLTQAARQAGVSEGMTPTQALARCSRLFIKSHSLAQERSAGEALLDVALSFSPWVEATGEGIATLELKGFPEIDYQQVGEKMIRSLLRLNLASQVGVAQNSLLALHAARSASPFRLVENSKEFLDDLPIESLEPSPQILSILAKWGIQTLGGFVALGKEPLAVRLGPEALQLYDRASANCARPLRLVQSPATFHEQAEFEHEIETTEPLLLLLRRFIEQISARLEMACLVAQELTLRLTFSDNTQYEHNFRIPAPTKNIDTLFRMVQTHLETLKAGHPVIGLYLSAKPCRPASQQFDLFEAALRDPNRFYETLARLSALVGSDRAGVPVLEPTHRPDAFHLQSPKLDCDGSDKSDASDPSDIQEGAARGLCLRRFRPPRPIRLQKRGHGSIVLNSATSSERILHVSGPWPISGDWWDNHPWSRIEWDIQTDKGNLYRIFQQDSSWFMEGVYD